MVFFDAARDETGNPRLSVMPQWWYYLIITIPLTIVIFLAWIIWQRWDRPGLFGFSFSMPVAGKNAKHQSGMTPNDTVLSPLPGINGT